MNREPTTDTKEKIRAVAYVRVSTNDQGEGQSIGAQTERIKHYVALKGWTLVDIYEDRGGSAYDVSEHPLVPLRPEFKRMMDNVDKWDITIACYLNRFWRNTRKAMDWFAELRDLKKGFVAMDYNMDSTTAMGEFVLEFMSGLAKLESRQISERVHSSLDHKFNTDRFGWNTKPPYGYDLEGKGKRGKAHLVIHPFEAEGIKMAFKLILKHSLLDVALAMNRAGHTTKRDNPFNERAVMHIVHNPVYCGYCYRNNVLRKNEHEHIIDDDLFNEVQVALIKRRRGRNPRTQAPLVVGDKVIRAERVNANGGYYKPLGARVTV